MVRKREEEEKFDPRQSLIVSIQDGKFVLLKFVHWFKE